MTERHMQLEALATDEAMGVTFGPGEESVFPDGSSAACCTDCARRIIELAGNGVMYGWMEGTNPTTIVAHDQGHDFVVVDDRYLVDAWAKLVERSLEMAVLDLDNPADLDFVWRYYGDPDVWELAFSGTYGKPRQLRDLRSRILSRTAK